MTQMLSLVEYRATFSATVRAIAPESWRDQDIKAHMALQQAKHAGIWPFNRLRAGQVAFCTLVLSALAATGAALMCGYAVSFFLSHFEAVFLGTLIFSCAAPLITSRLSKSIEPFLRWKWQTFPVLTSTVYRGSTGNQYVPDFAHELIEEIRTFFPRARFEISVLGPIDPVLWCLDEFSEEKIAVLVWNEYKDIVLPPRLYE